MFRELPGDWDQIHQLLKQRAIGGAIVLQQARCGVQQAQLLHPLAEIMQAMNEAAERAPPAGPSSTPASIVTIRKSVAATEPIPPEVKVRSVTSPMRPATNSQLDSYQKM
ncbi:MAG: hypothetical protein RL685_2238 [Pseudomonadota bacterium]|jgi:hypothetical protein